MDLAVARTIARNLKNHYQTFKDVEEFIDVLQGLTTRESELRRQIEAHTTDLAGLKSTLADTQGAVEDALRKHKESMATAKKEAAAAIAAAKADADTQRQRIADKLAQEAESAEAQRKRFEKEKEIIADELLYMQGQIDALKEKRDALRLSLSAFLGADEKGV